MTQAGTITLDSCGTTLLGHDPLDRPMGWEQMPNENERCEALNECQRRSCDDGRPTQRNPEMAKPTQACPSAREHSELVQQRIVQRPEQGVKETDHKGDVEPSMRRQKGDPQTEILDADQAARTPDGARASSKIDAKMDQGTLWSHEGEESHDADDRGHQEG